MNKIKDFTSKEREEFSDLYTEVINSIYECREILGADEVNKRAYVSKIESIHEYLKRIDDADYKADKKGFLDIFKSDESYKKELLDFKKTIQHDIRFTKKCVQCKCLNCKTPCSFDGCKNCNLTEIVISCNKEDKVIYDGMPNVKIFHHDFNRELELKVLGRLLYKDAEYLLLRNIEDENDLQLYRYVVETNGCENFESLSSEEIDEIWDIFLEMGVGR